MRRLARTAGGWRSVEDADNHFRNPERNQALDALVLAAELAAVREEMVATFRDLAENADRLHPENYLAFLHLRPGDTLVYRAHSALSEDEAARIKDWLETFLRGQGISAPVLVVSDASLEILVADREAS